MFCIRLKIILRLHAWESRAFTNMTPNYDIEQCKYYGKFPDKTCILYSAYEWYINKHRSQIKIRTYVSGYRGLGKRMEVSS